MTLRLSLPAIGRAPEAAEAGQEVDAEERGARLQRGEERPGTQALGHAVAGDLARAPARGTERRVTARPGAPGPDRGPPPERRSP